MKGVQAAVLGGSALILLILALRLTLKNHLPHRLFPALWCIAAIRFLLPVEIPTRLSVWNLLRGTAEMQAGPIAAALLPFPRLVSAQSEAAAAAGPDWKLLLWIGIAVILAAYFGIGYVCMTRRFRSRRILPQPSVDVLLERFRFTRDPKICTTESRRAPLTFGIFRPTVLLPDDLQAGQVQFQLVLAHELAHIRRKDCLRKLLLAACLCLYWWNPLVWLMVRLANRDMELACDEAVLRALGPVAKNPTHWRFLTWHSGRSGRRPFAAALPEAARKSVSARFCVSAGFLSGRAHLRQRCSCLLQACLQRRRRPLSVSRKRLWPCRNGTRFSRPLLPRSRSFILIRS